MAFSRPHKMLAAGQGAWIPAAPGGGNIHPTAPPSFLPRGDPALLLPCESSSATSLPAARGLPFAGPAATAALPGDVGGVWSPRGAARPRWGQAGSRAHPNCPQPEVTGSQRASPCTDQGAPKQRGQHPPLRAGGLPRAWTPSPRQSISAPAEKPKGQSPATVLRPLPQFPLPQTHTGGGAHARDCSIRGPGQPQKPGKRIGARRCAPACPERGWEAGHTAAGLLRARGRPALPDYLPKAPRERAACSVSFQRGNESPWSARSHFPFLQRGDPETKNHEQRNGVCVCWGGDVPTVLPALPSAPHNHQTNFGTRQVPSTPL